MRTSYVLSVDEGNGTFRTGVVATNFELYRPEQLDALAASSGQRVAVFEIENGDFNSFDDVDLTFEDGTKVALTNATIDKAVCVRSPVPSDTQYFFVIKDNEAVVAVYKYDRAFGIIEYLRYAENVDCKIAVVAVGDGIVEPGYRVEITEDGRALNFYQGRNGEADEVPCAYFERCDGNRMLVDVAAID